MDYADGGWFMVEYLLISLVLIAVYSGLTALNVWFLSRIPFVRKSTERLIHVVDRLMTR